MVMVESMFFDPHHYNSRCASLQNSTADDNYYKLHTLRQSLHLPQGISH